MSNKYKLSPTERLNYVQKGRPSSADKLRSARRFFSTFFLLFLLVLILIPYYEKTNKKKMLEREIDKELQNISKYEKNNKELENFIEYLSSEQAVEESARLNFGLQKEGETVVVVKMPVKKEKKIEEIDNENQKDDSCFKKWYNYFFE